MANLRKIMKLIRLIDEAQEEVKDLPPSVEKVRIASSLSSAEVNARRLAAKEREARKVKQHG